HSGERPWRCGECGKGFGERAALGKHRRTHSGERPFSCGRCGKGFGGASGLRKHERTHGREEEGGAAGGS
ncbi:ZN668 protein, partial [Erythrocercus mccallii]|nr:ZN668 protein [Erythrocercus mccallii]